MYLVQAKNQQYYIARPKILTNINQRFCSSSILVTMKTESLILIFDKCSVYPSCKIYSDTQVYEYPNNGIIKVELFDEDNFPIYQKYFELKKQRLDIDKDCNQFFLWGSFQLDTRIGEIIGVKKLTNPYRWDLIMEVLDSNYLTDLRLPDDSHPCNYDLVALV